MMKTRVLSFLAAFLIITVAFSVAFMEPVSADDPLDWEPDNDEAIYLRPDGQVKNYNYNYTDVALEEDIELRDTTGGEKRFSYDSEMSLTANVRSVKPCSDVNNVRIAISAPGAYRWNESESIYNPNDSFTPFGHVGTLGTAIEAEITGMEGWENKPEESPPKLLMHPEYNSGDNFTDGDGDAGCHDTDPDEWQELAVEGCILAAEIGLAAMDVKTLGALSATHYALKLASTYAESDPIDPLPEHEISDSYNGEEASVSQSWEHNIAYKAEREYHLFNLDYSEYEEHLEEGPVDQELIDAFDEKGHEIADWADLEELDDDEWAVVNENGGWFTLEKHEEKLKIFGEDIPLERAHTASTMLYFELPTDDLPDEATLEISAKNILGAAEQDGEIIDFADGAEATVEIPIKNAEIDSIGSENKGSDPHISGLNSASLDDEVSMKFELTPSGTFVAQEEEVPPPEAPKVDLTVDWAASEENYNPDPYTVEGWKPYHWEYAGYGQEPDGYYEGHLSEEDIQVNSDQYGNGDELNMPYFHWYERVDDEATPLHVYEDLEGLGLDEGEEMEITVEITVEVLDQYGGWEESIEYEVTIEREEDDNGGGGGGGGGDPPPNLPSGDDT